VPTFIYQAKNDKGQIVSGTIKADNERVATQTLWENKLKVITLQPQPIVPSFSFLKKVKVADKAIFARQLSTMIGAGIHLTSALKICLNQSQNKRLQEVLEQVIRDVEGGYSFSASISKHPDVFDHVFVAVVRAGEAAGKLDEVLLSLADRLERDAAFVGRVKSALVYPAFVFTVLIIVGALMVIKVVPQLKTIFTEAGATLPWATRTLIGVSDFLNNFWWGVLIGIVLIAVGFRFYIQTPRGTFWWNSFAIKVPIFGELNKSIVMARFTRTFCLLVQTGIPILDSLHIIADVMDNEVYKKSLYKIASDVEKGVPLSVPLSKDKNFPPIIGQMAGVGEQSGALDQIFDRLGIFYEREVEDKTKTLSALVEPVVIVMLGFGVAILVFAIIMPIYQLAQTQ
jgi:type IV pilus assembly protein PilC